MLFSERLLWKIYIGVEGGEKENRLLDGCQTSPACHYDKGSAKTKTFGWLEAVA
jgi:hypothetical protein